VTFLFYPPILIHKYRTEPEVLDGLLQWSENPTSMSAGYGIEENYSFIKSNLSIRYNQDTAEKVIGILRKESERLTLEAQKDIYLAERSIHEALEHSEILEEQLSKNDIHILQLDAEIVAEETGTKAIYDRAKGR